jgi:hypothetical protein
MHIAPTVLGVTKRSECVVSSATKEEAKESKRGRTNTTYLPAADLTSVNRFSMDNWVDPIA